MVGGLKLAAHSSVMTVFALMLFLSLLGLNQERQQRTYVTTMVQVRVTKYIYCCLAVIISLS